MTSLDPPNSGVDASQALGDSVAIPEAPPIAAFSDPPPENWPALTAPVEDPLEQIDHPRVDVLACYSRAGWMHSVDHALLRSGAARRLYTAAERLPPRWGLAVFDAWRPLDLQVELFDAAYADPALPDGFVARPSDNPLTPPPHLSGGTVDVTLSHDGVALALGTRFDDFTPRAHTRALEHEPGINRSLRRLLFQIMIQAGFVALDCEWWHYEFGTRRWAAITGAEPIYGAAAPDLRSTT